MTEHDVHTDRSPADPDPADHDPTGAPDPAGGTGGTVLLVRRRRVPALGFWIAVILAVAFVGGTVVGFLADVRTASGLLYFGVVSLFVIGLPVGLIAAIVDAILERRRSRRDRRSRRAADPMGG